MSLQSLRGILTLRERVALKMILLYVSSFRTLDLFLRLVLVLIPLQVLQVIKRQFPVIIEVIQLQSFTHVFLRLFKPYKKELLY